MAKYPLKPHYIAGAQKNPGLWLPPKAGMIASAAF
jgi:hypothetical protein